MVMLRQDMTINGVQHKKGSTLAWYKVYPFFLVHMLAFGGSGFLMAYGESRPPVFFLYLHGGFAILIYTLFYLSFFGRDEVKWMFINALLGLFGIYAQIGWILGLFGKDIGDYPWYLHVVPFLYYILYTFLLWQAVLDASGALQDESRRSRTEKGYVAVSVFVYLALLILERQ